MARTLLQNANPDGVHSPRVLHGPLKSMSDSQPVTDPVQHAASEKPWGHPHSCNSRAMRAAAIAATRGKGV